jgi:hypothetical protein
MDETARTAPRRWEARIFFGLALLAIVPFWTSTYLPTTDGPCHLYNAWVLLHHGDAAALPQLGAHYEVDHRPLPNWLSHGALALSMLALPPLAAEKVLASAYVLTFLGGLWTLVGAIRPGSRWPAFLGFAFLYNFLFQFGFYNFSFSLGLFFFAVALWWRGRDAPGWRWALKLNLLLWLGWFAHILTVVFSLFAIGVLWLATLERKSWKRHLLHVAWLTPQLVLPLWFLGAEGSETSNVAVGRAELVRYFLRLGPLVTFSPWQAVGASLLVILFALLAAATLVRAWRARTSEGGETGERGVNAFPLLAALFFALYLFGPDGMSGGSMLKPRLCLYPFLLLLPWFARDLPEWGRRGLVALLSLLALANIALQIERYRALSPLIEAYVQGLDPVPPGSRVLPLTFDHQAPGGVIPIYNHALGHAALAKGLIDWDNYEAASTLFPVRFKPEVHRPTIYAIESDPAHFDLASYLDAVDYVYTWGMPAEAPVAATLGRFYRPVATSGEGVLFRRRTHLRPPRPAR